MTDSENQARDPTYRDQAPLATSTGIQDPVSRMLTLLEKGGDVEVMKKMMDMANEWKANQAKQAFARSMNECQQEMPIILEDAENTHTRSRYASLEAVNRVCKPCYCRHGFSIQFSEGEPKDPAEVRIIADVIHAEGHERRYYVDLARDGVGIKGNSNMTPLQGKGSTFSYGQRYLVKMIFNLTISGEDTDGQGPQGLSDDQTATINTLFEDIRTIQRPSDEDWEKWKIGFWHVYGIKHLTELRPYDFPKVKAELERLVKKARKA
jgi:hypothetical protein